MLAAKGMTLFVVMIALCAGLTVVLIVGGAVLLLWVGRNVTGPMRSRQLRSMLDDWAAKNGCTVVDVRPAESRNHPFADRFGFGKRPGLVQRIAVRDRRGRTRHGWAYVRAWVTAKGSSGFVPDSLEVAWAE